MTLKIIGAFLIIICCGGVGFCTAAAYRKEVANLRQLMGALEYMANDLQYRMTPLPDLCRNTALICSDCIKNVMLSLCDELEGQLSPDVQSCMFAVLQRFPDISKRIRKALNLLGSSLGRFDVDGQIRSINSVIDYIKTDLVSLQNNQAVRVRSYQTLGLCAGAALAILLV